MSYIDNNLVPGETVVYRAKLHWFVFVPWAIVAFLLSRLWNAAPVVLAIPLAKYFGTEIAVTNRRVVLKTGWFSLKTIEMNLSKVESVSVAQGVVGRSWGYGTVRLIGSGGTGEPFPGIAAPMEFQRAVQSALSGTGQPPPTMT